MVSFIRMSGSIGAVALAGAALTTAVAPAAQAAASSSTTIGVPCRADRLAAAITRANTLGGATLSLPGNCTYSVATPATAADGLPLITGNVLLAGGHNTEIRRTGAASFRLLDVASGGTLFLNSVAVTRGSTAGLGGGILNAGTLIIGGSSRLSGNKASNGGAVSNSNGATARISDTLITGNTTTGVGGGGIINFGTLTLAGSILTGNTAPINGGALNTQPSGTTRISQSTFTLNTSGGLGGAIANLGTTSLTGTTVRRNTASGGGGIATGNAHVTLRASTVTDNAPTNCNPLNTIQGCHN